MALKVVGAGVGRTGTHSLKVALERLLGAPCHHMVEVLGHPEQMPVLVDAIDGKPVDWDAFLAGYAAAVDWPLAGLWPEVLGANPDALVLLSVRDPEAWYESASNTIFVGMDRPPEELGPWFSAVRRLLSARFCNDFGDKAAMIAAFERHNASVREQVPADQLLEWAPGDGWQPICERLGLPVPDEPFPVTNTTDDFRAMMGLPARQ